ncbi:MAG: hypothetical protein ACKPKO_63270, partial [Candidatus Fonsibacter sp.]
MNMIELTPTETIMYNDVVINDILLTDQYIILGPNTDAYTWTENVKLSSHGTITATRTISTTTGNIGSPSEHISIPPAVFPESNPIYTPAADGTDGFTVPPVTAKFWNEPFLPVIVPADAVMFPTVLIVPPAIKVVPALFEPTVAIVPTTSIVDCDIIAPDANIEQLERDIAGSPTFNPLLH